MTSKIPTSKNKTKPSTPLGPKHPQPKTQTQFYVNPTAKHQAVKDFVEGEGYSFPHFQYPAQPEKPLPTAQDSFSPSKVKNKDLNASKPKFVSEAEEAAYVEQLKTQAKTLGIQHILTEAMSNKPGNKLHASFSTKIPSQESLTRTAEAMALLNQKNIGYSTHTLARVLQDGQAITLMKAVKEFCENRADSSTFLAYDHRFDLNKKEFYNQFHFFRVNSATKQAIQIPLSPPQAKQKDHQSKILKARTVIANHAQQFNNRLKSGKFEILHTEDGHPITTNAQYQQERLPKEPNGISKNLADQFTKINL